MRIELKDFLYELGKYADQTHILKDKYEKLADDEKVFVLQHSPDNQLSPIVQDKLAFDWLSTMQQEIGAADEK
ncbi:hypothetical protein F3157_20985 [Virgibacillus dakarensis]|uniref:Uncharacterized protein n=1 Tax=Lentibacillus populi TaxID=1827502 RepID=A0A9W5X763_9BACI|nr:MULTISPECIES: hypothetical protein [Bacillaceae]MTW88073.1 hypothetical protein [Virgibacillus dakarensis]GGB53375.1 hypothetical protein GCM10011409_33710 [Lentibacillus populi]